jgi:uncharacterized protein YjiS (DUF1127 family)
MNTLRLPAHDAPILLSRRYALRALLETLDAWSSRVSGRRELAGLSDVELKDIGLTRMDARMEAEKPFWQA